MNTNRFLTSMVIIAFVLGACSSTSGQPAAAVSTVPPPTSTPLPTATLLPTYTLTAEISPTVIVPTATIELTPTTDITPKFPSELIKPNRITNGNTAQANDMWYFAADAGQIISMTLVGEPYYQSFSLRDDTNKGLIGCKRISNTVCFFENYTLPYTGLYYILVDRTMNERFVKEVACTTEFPFPSWCYRGGPYALDFKLQ